MRSIADAVKPFLNMFNNSLCVILKGNVPLPIGLHCRHYALRSNA